MNQWSRLTLLAAASVAYIAAAAAGCSAGDTVDIEDDGGQTASTTGSTGGGGSGGATTTSGTGGNTGPCGTDCSLINTPQCQVAQCNVQSGQCEVVNDEEGVACDDGVFCTISDSCSAGTCVGGPANDCGMAPPQCTEVTCDEQSQTCSSAPSMNGAACQDPNDLCLQGSTCSNGLCIGGTANDCFFFPVPSDCHVATCNPNNGMCEAVVGNEGASCNDPNDLCTVNKICATGVCQGGNPKDCSNLTMGCDLGVCDTMTGQCVTQAVMNGQACDDLDFCTSGEICTNSTCGGGTVETQCMTGDGCCPSGCTINNDLDCIVPVTRAAIHRGWWRDDGNHTSSNNNTINGYCCGSSDHNAYFIFDLSGINGSTVLSAELHIELESYTGTSTTTNLPIYDVSTPPATVEASGSSVAVYTDLQTGNPYGSFSVTAQDVNNVLVVVLNAQALTDIAAALGGQFAIGVDNVGAMPATDWVRWSSSNEARTHELHLQVF
jgi:hypothetical protein